jgi:tetratricopeptide (TPR) repeat protein
MNNTTRIDMVFASEYLNKPKELSDFIDSLFLLHENGFERFNDTKDFSKFLDWEIEEIGNWFFDKEIYNTCAKAYKEIVLRGNKEASERISDKIFNRARRIKDEFIIDVLELMCVFYQFPSAYASLAMISNTKHDFDNGLEYAKRALALSNNENQYHLILGDCFFHNKAYEKAIDCYKKVLLSKTTPKEIADYSNKMIKNACDLIDSLKRDERKIGK